MSVISVRMMKRQTSAVREDDGLKTEERTEYHHVQQREQRLEFMNT